MIEFHKRAHLVNIEASRLPTTIFTKNFLPTNKLWDSPSVLPLRTYFNTFIVGPCIIPFDKRQLSEQHIAHRIQFRNYESKFSNFVLIESNKLKKMTPTGIVSSNEISSTTGIYEGFKNKIPKISSNDISSNMVSSSTGPTHSNTISNTKFLKHLAAEISIQVSSTSGKS